MMDPDEQELQSDGQYRAYRAVIEKALRNFESSSEWADLIPSLGKLTKALQSDLRYSLLPKRLIICKRLAQCLHPALPSGVHLKALETYEVIFKIIGTKWLAKDLFIYSSGLFPLLAHAAMSVRPVLLKLYERYFLPLQRALLPSLQAFVMGLLPGLEEGLEVYDRTDALMVKLSLLVGQQLLYGALWSCMLINPLVRLPASSFIVSHFDRMGSGPEQRYMLGTNHPLVMKALYLSLQDSNVLVQRNMLEILLFFFPLSTCLDPADGSIPMTRDDVVTIMSAASLTLLRRDLSLNRRIYAWLLGTDFKGGMVAADPSISTSLERHAAFYFSRYSRGFLTQALINILDQREEDTDSDTMVHCLRPLRVMTALLEKPEIGVQVAGELMLEVVRSLHRQCRMQGQSSSITGEQVSRESRVTRNTSEMIRTLNVLIGSLGSEYLWDYISQHFETCLSTKACAVLPDSGGDSGVPSIPEHTNMSAMPTPAPSSISELSTLIGFLLDVFPLELYCEVQTQYLPQMLVRLLRVLQGHMNTLSLDDLTQSLNTCLKILSKIQMPAAHLSPSQAPWGQGQARSPAQEVEEGQVPEDQCKAQPAVDDREPKEEPKTEQPMREGEPETEQPIREGEPETEQPIREGKRETEQPIREGEPETEQTIREGEIETEQPIKEGETETEQPIREGEPQTEQPIREGEPETEQPIREGKPETEQPIREGGPETEQPIREGEPEIEQPIREGEPETEQPIREGEPETEQPIRGGEPETEQPIREGEQEKAQPIMDGKPETVDSIREKDPDSAEPTGEKELETADPIREKNPETAEPIGEKELETADPIREKDPETAEPIGEKELETADPIREKDPETAEPIGEKELETADPIREKDPETAEPIGEKELETADPIREKDPETAEPIGEKELETADPIREKNPEIAEPIGEKELETAGPIREKNPEIAKPIGEKELETADPMRKQDPEIAKPINEGEPETAEPVEAGDGIFPVSAQAECSRPSPPPLPSEPGSLLGEGEAGEGVGDGLGFGPEGLEVWRRGGSVETLAQCVQDILTSFITRYLSFVEELEEDTGLAGQAMGPGGPGDSWGSCMPDRPALQTVECPSGDRGSRAVGQQETGEGPSAQVAQGVSEMGSQAFSAICHLLLESTSLPLYLSEQEMEALHSCMSPRTLHTGSVEGTLPPWLRSLMLCCVLEDPSVQHAAVSCVLELLRRSQALLLLLQDKGRRHGHSDHSPFCGRLQTLAIPPVTHTILTTIANSTDFYQHVAQVLWGQLDAEQRNLHVPSVDLFYRLHVLAPSPSVCEDVICQELLHRDKRIRLEALQRFSALWHLTREIQTNVNTLFNRCFDRSLLVVLDGLNSQDGSLSAVSQSWLVRALSLNDVVRIMEPILLLLLHPKTQRCSIQWIKQNLTVGNLQQLSCRGRSFSEDSTGSADAMATDDQSEDSLLSCISIVDREALWAELEGTPETTPPAEDRIEKKEQGEETGQRDEEEGQESEPTQLAQLCTASAGSLCPLQDLQHHSSMDQTLPPSLPRADSTPSLGSDLLSEDEEEEDEEEATAYLRLLKQEQEQREALESLFRHTLLYLQLYDPTPVLLALSTIETLLRSCPAPFLQTLYSAQIHPGSAHLRLVNSLTQRHLEAQEGRRFYGPLPPPSSSQPRHPSTLLQLLTCVLLQYLRSHFPCYLQVSVRAMGGNREVRVKSAELLALLMQQLGSEARGGATAAEIVREVLWGCRVQRYALLALCVSMYVTQKEGSVEGLGVGPGEGLLEQGGGVSEEHLINLGGGGVLGEQALQVELLKLLQVLISLEHQVWPGGGGAGAGAGQEGVSPLGRAWQAAALFQQSARSLQYVQTRPLPAQAMLVSAAARALQPRYGYALHGHWVALMSASLPYLGSSLATISAPFITQICKNLDELVTQHLSESRLLAQPDTPEAENLTTSWSLRRESIAPDYLLMLLEGLTSITHYCLLENRRSPVVPDPADLRNARDIMLDEFPRMLNSMAMLWHVVQREEPQTTSNSAPTCSRNCSTSIYFRSSKILRQKVLGFLNPLTEEFGVRVMASVGIVWGSQSDMCINNKNKILPIANEIQQTVVGLIKSLSALSTNTILQLIREVLKTKPPRAKREQKLSQTALPMLHFSLTLIQSVPAELLLQSGTPVLCLLRESLQLPMPPHGYFLLLGILNDFVSRAPNLDSRKYSRDLQEVTQQVLEAVGMVAGSSLEQTSWLSRNLEVKAPRKDPELPSLYDPNPPADAIATVTCHSDQALSLLAEVLAPLLDVVFRSNEKEKATPLISRLLEYVFPYLRNHRVYNAAGFSASARLLSSLSEYSYTKRCWRREAFELFMDPLFFRMDPSCIAHWVSTIDHLLTYEKTMFKDLTSTQSPSLFSNQEQRALLLKRQAFAMFSGEPDQYCPYLPLIQERLTESLRVGQTPLVMSQIFLLFRVLLLRTSPQHLISLWPVMVTELIHVFVKLEKDLLEGQEVARNPNKGWGVSGTRERNGPVQGTRERSRPPLDLPQSELEMYLSACKLLDSMLCFPPERIPLFQMYRWAFVPEVDMDSYSGPGNSIMEGEQECQPHVVRVLEGLHYRYPELSGAGEHAGVEHLEFPLLTLNALSSIAQLEPFFRVLSCAPAGPTAADWPQAMASHTAQNGSSILSKLNHVCMEDFLENMDS